MNKDKKTLFHNRLFIAWLFISLTVFTYIQVSLGSESLCNNYQLKDVPAPEGVVANTLFSDTLPSGQQRILVGSQDGIYWRNLNNPTWSAAVNVSSSAKTKVEFANIIDFVRVPEGTIQQADCQLLALKQGEEERGEFFCSGDNGEHWNLLPVTGYPDGHGGGLVTDEQALYYFTSTNGDPGGRTAIAVYQNDQWVTVYEDPKVGISDMCYCDGALYTASASGVITSPPPLSASSTWTPVNQGLASYDVTGISCMDNTLFAATEAGIFFMSLTGSTENPVWHPVSRQPGNLQTRLLGGGDGLMYFTNQNKEAIYGYASDGTAQQPISLQPLTLADSQLNRVLPDRQNHNLKLATSAGLFSYNLNTGTWSADEKQLQAVQMTDILQLDSPEELVVVSGNRGVYYSPDGGSHWHNFYQGLVSMNVDKVTVDGQHRLTAFFRNYRIAQTQSLAALLSGSSWDKPVPTDTRQQSGGSPLPPVMFNDRIYTGFNAGYGHGGVLISNLNKTRFSPDSSLPADINPLRLAVSSSELYLLTTNSLLSKKGAADPWKTSCKFNQFELQDLNTRLLVVRADNENYFIIHNPENYSYFIPQKNCAYGNWSQEGVVGVTSVVYDPVSNCLFGDGERTNYQYSFSEFNTRDGGCNDWQAAGEFEYLAVNRYATQDGGKTIYAIVNHPWGSGFSKLQLMTRGTH